MAEPIKIAVDAMGGDNSPKKIIQGISLHSKNSENIDYKIFGDENQIKLLIDKHPIKNKFSIIHTSEKILND